LVLPGTRTLGGPPRRNRPVGLLAGRQHSGLASLDQTIGLWDVTDPTNGRALSAFRGHRASVNALALLPDNTTLVSGSTDCSVCFWNTATSRRGGDHVTLPVLVGPWRFAADSKSVVILEDQGPAAVVARWQGVDFQERVPLLNLGTNVYEACISEDGRWLATTSWTGSEVQVWDLHSRNQSCEFTANAKSVVPCQFMAQGSRLVILHELTTPCTNGT